MPRVDANGIRLEYEISGPQDGQALLMIHGLGTQLTRWSPAFCDQLAVAGFRTIRFDNRDTGLSTHLDGVPVPVPDLAAVVAARRRGEEPDVPYSVADMADDADGLLGSLDVINPADESAALRTSTRRSRRRARPSPASPGRRGSNGSSCCRTSSPSTRRGCRSSSRR